jgi:hypothetical protein
MWLLSGVGAWLGREERTDPADHLTAEELKRLARWAQAYRAEAEYGAENGKKWGFARYLVETGRLNEDFGVAHPETEYATPCPQRTTTLNCAVGGGSLPSSALGCTLTKT